jgi:ABC-type Mn2+/Zn2+ transport system ATPase subunit
MKVLILRAMLSRADILLLDEVRMSCRCSSLE